MTFQLDDPSNRYPSKAPTSCIMALKALTFHRTMYGAPSPCPTCFIIIYSHLARRICRHSVTSPNHPDSLFALEPRPDCARSTRNWPHPNIVEAVAGHVRILNNTTEPQHLARHEHFCQVLPTLTSDVSIVDNTLIPVPPPSTAAEPIPLHSSTVQLDPDHILPETSRAAFQQLLHSYYSVFDPSISGYNGAVGPFEAIINMGPVQPPQRKGRLPQYSRNKLVQLQAKFDEVERQGVFQRPEDIGITIEYLKPSFLVTKPSCGHRLVTAFADVARYSKPQPSLIPSTSYPGSLLYALAGGRDPGECWSRGSQILGATNMSPGRCGRVVLVNRCNLSHCHKIRH